MRFEDYAIRVDPLPDDEGGGFRVTVPDLPACMADGETVALAIAEARDAFEAWTTAEREDRGELPTPKTYRGQFVQRIPKSLHQRLARRAATEGVSLNQLAAMFLAQGLAGRQVGKEIDSEGSLMASARFVRNPALAPWRERLDRAAWQQREARCDAAG